ncbi:MAG: AEC family transporter, partial [Balneolaceae bacterium]
MDNLLLVFTSLLIGILLRRSPKSPRDTHEVLNRFVIYVSLPALVLVYIPAIEIDRTLLYPVLSAWLVLLIAIIIIPLLGKLAGWDRNTIGCLLLTAGFGNTAFVGFPVIEALYGSEGLRIALLVDQPGTFMALSTAGIVIASIYSSGRTRKRVILRKVFLFPPFIMFLLAICM